MRHATLFSGIGAPELAADWLGWENVFHCEINPFCWQVLNYWFRKSESYEDITKTDFRKWNGKIDVLTGGFPCQPFSVAGKRKGAEDNRYLWPEFKRAIREIRPSWIIGENVGGITSMVQPCKEADLEKVSTKSEKIDNGSIIEQEFVVETICKDIEQEGYTVQPVVIPACAVGAPHRRDRIWFIACNEGDRTIHHTDRNRRICTHEFTTDTHNSAMLRGSCKVHGAQEKKWLSERLEVQQSGQSNSAWKSSSHSIGGRQCCWGSDRSERPTYSDEDRKFTQIMPDWSRPKSWTGKDDADFTYSNCSGIKREYFEKSREEQFNGRNSPNNYTGWENFPTQPAICGGDDGIPGLLDSDAIFKGIGFNRRSSAYNRWRTEAIKAYGNAMVPQVIYEIYRCIDEIEHGARINFPFR